MIVISGNLRITFLLIFIASCCEYQISLSCVRNYSKTRRAKLLIEEGPLTGVELVLTKFNVEKNLVETILETKQHFTALF